MNADRNMIRERTWTLEAALDAGVDGRALVEFAEERAGSDPVCDLERRDFATEVLEELADGRNYLVWWMEQNRRGRNDPVLREALRSALSAVALAYDDIITAPGRAVAA